MRFSKWLSAGVALLTLVVSVSPAEAWIFQNIAARMQARQEVRQQVRASRVAARQAVQMGYSASPTAMVSMGGEAYQQVQVRSCRGGRCTTTTQLVPVASAGYETGPPTYVSSGGSSGYSATYGAAPTRSYGSSGGLPQAVSYQPSRYAAAPAQPAPPSRPAAQAVASCDCNGECGCPCCPCRPEAEDPGDFDFGFAAPAEPAGDLTFAAPRAPAIDLAFRSPDAGREVLVSL